MSGSQPLAACRDLRTPPFDQVDPDLGHDAGTTLHGRAVPLAHAYDLRDATFDYWRSRFGTGPVEKVDHGLILVTRLVLPLIGHLPPRRIDDELLLAIDLVLSAQVPLHDVEMAMATLRAVLDFARTPEPAA
jgi:hypothetical protein